MTSRYAVTIDENGANAPSFDQVLTNLQEDARGIFGADIYLGNDSQDGQLLGVLAKAISDANDSVIAAKNSFSPAGAVGNGLSSQVKVNGIRRNDPSYSTADLRIIGVAGTVINNGVVRDGNNVQWRLPAAVTIPLSGDITVTAIASDKGAIKALPSTINQIATPTRGWQTASNTLAAVEGLPVEIDGQLRIRQTQSVALPSRTILEGMAGAIASLPNVKRLKYYENDTGTTDANGIPEHSTSAVIEGGDAQAIADVIIKKKTPGSGTYGTTSQATVDIYGNPATVRFYRPTDVRIWVEVQITAKTGYLTDTGVRMQKEIADYITAFDIGQEVDSNELNLPALLFGDPLRKTYEVDEILIGISAGVLSVNDIAIAFNEAAFCEPENVTITVA